MLVHQAVRAWFERRFPHGPTAAQADGWPAIARGENTLIAAPTGSGKTLAAFLVCLDRLYCAAAAGTLEDTTHVVYVSPLKALAADIEQNLQAPLAQIADVARELGLTAPEIRVALRTGDTPPATRAAMLRRPPHIVITTPESLYLMLTARRSRETLRTAHTLIIDEIHALARDKRGAHLALSVERLEHVCERRLVRIGLSATQRPIERVARLLVGAGPEPPACTIVDSGHRRELDLALELPGSELEAVASAEQVGEVLDRIAALIGERRTTLVFVNTRRLSERIAHQLAERLGEEQVAAHHGSLSKERRGRIEARLRAGDLRAVVATASLELGIDVGPVELVCQIGSPRSIATFLQRVGRSGHSRFATPVGRLFPLTRDELVECTALLWAVRSGTLDATPFPAPGLDVLAQQVVAECAAEEWDERALYELMRRAAPYAALSNEEFERVVELMSEGIATGRGTRAAYLHRDRVAGRLKGRRSARLSALTSGGAIPETADYRVIAEPGETFVGTINEDFAIESMAGDVFLLGSSSWRIRRVERGIVRVVDAAGAAPTIPFWLGEAPARTIELSQHVGELRSRVQEFLATGAHGAARSFLQTEAGASAVAADEVLSYLHASQTALGRLPTQRDLVFERFFDDTGGMQLVLHSPLGGRLNRALGLLLRKRFCTSFDFELQAAASDDAIVLSLGPAHSFPLEQLTGFLKRARVRDALMQAVLPTPMFAVRWRHNLNRSLVVLRFKRGKRNPPALQRMEADDVMVSVFPALAACQDNANGPREIPDHLLVQQTLADCFTEAMDVEALEALLLDIEQGRVRLHFRDTTEPSPLSHEILNSRPYTFLDDAPLEERRTRALNLRRGLPVHARDLAALDPDAIDRVRREATPEPRDRDELHDLLLSVVVYRPMPGHLTWLGELEAQGRVLAFTIEHARAFCAIERRAVVEAAFPEARFSSDARLALSPRDAAPDAEAAASQIVRGHLDVLGVSSEEEICAATLLAAPSVQLALARLEGEGFSLRGALDPRSLDERYCARRLLARVHVYTRARLRREIEPVSSQDYARFLLRFQRVEDGSRLTGPGGVLRAIEQLQGVELAASAWESDILPARVEGYRREWLDQLCVAGEVVWGRLTLPAQKAGGPACSVTEGRSLAPSRVTPITLALRADLSWLLRGARGERRAELTELGDSAEVIRILQRRGASFTSELALEAGISEAAVLTALADGVARGLVTSDGFQALRALLGRSRPPPGLPQRASLRRGLSGRSPGGGGRWALMPDAPDDLGQADAEAVAEAVAEQLLARWGVVFRDVFALEHSALSWRDVAWGLRRLEDRGRVRGGRFISGFVGEQYALPEAVDMLRAVRRAPPDGRIVRLSACDPLNLTGTLLLGTRVPALASRTIELRDGLPVEDAERVAAGSLAERASRFG